MAAPPLPILHDRYRILTKLGQGRLAVVYRAHDDRLQRAVLVHLLREELNGQTPLQQRFLEEAQRAAQRTHHGLLDVYDSGEIAGRPYMVTEDIAGQPLAELIPLPLADAVVVLRTVTSAVALAQSQGSPHPPVSSQNVWIAEGGRAILLENWLLPPQAAALDLAHYRAPERVQGQAPSPSTTVYALGILAWETIAGRRPFSGATPDAIAHEQLGSSLPLLREMCPLLFAPELERIMLGTTAPDPQQRYPTPADLARAWDFFVDGATAQTGRLVPAPSPDQQTTVSVRALRRSPATSAEVAPSPVRTVPRMPAPRISPPPMAQPDGMATTPVGRPPGRWSGARRRLQRALIRRSIQIALILAALFALLAGVDYGLDRVRALDPAGWIAQQLPDLRLPGFSLPDWRELVGLSSGGRLVVNQSINLRPAPGINNTPLRELPAGTVLQKIGGPVPDPQELSLTWIEVVVVGEDAQGWVAEHPDRLRPEE